MLFKAIETIARNKSRKKYQTNTVHTIYKPTVNTNGLAVSAEHIIFIQKRKEKRKMTMITDVTTIVQVIFNQHMVPRVTCSQLFRRFCVCVCFISILCVVCRASHYSESDEKSYIFHLI